jgi:protein-tyrosine kinase
MNTQKNIIQALREIEDSGKTGSLFLSQDRPGQPESIRIYFREGLINAISSSLHEFRVGQYLLKEGLLDGPELDDLLKKSRNRRPLGEEAVDADLLDPLDVRESIYGQSLELFRRALERGYEVGRFDQSAGTEFRFPLSMELNSLLLELARKTAQPFGMNSHRRLVLKRGREFSNLPWKPDEVAAISQLRQPRTFEELLSETGLREADLRRVLNTLNHVNLLEVLPAEEDCGGALVKKERFPLELLVPEIGDAHISDQLETLLNEDSFASEQFTSLKVKIVQSKIDSPHQVVTITSPHMEDGKSLVSVNLAFSFARDAGRRVILIDCDLRRPSLHRYLGTQSHPGVIDFLNGGTLKPYCYMRRLRNLFVMTSGGEADNPVGLLSSERMRELLQYLRTEFDTILIDSPPIHPISDARILCDLADGTVLVVRRGKTPYGTIEKTLESVVRKKLIGAVLNDVKPLPFHTYHHHGYYYYGSDSAYPYQARKDRRRRPSSAAKKVREQL